jgi:hypothetical protein
LQTGALGGEGATLASDAPDASVVAGLENI